MQLRTDTVTPTSGLTLGVILRLDHVMALHLLALGDALQVMRHAAGLAERVRLVSLGIALDTFKALLVGTFDVRN